MNIMEKLRQKKEIQGKHKIYVPSYSQEVHTFSKMSEDDDDPLLMKTTSIGVFDDVRETLLAQILDPLLSRNIVTISGMGGLGKTTLAKYIYDSVDAVRHFDVRAWVSGPPTSDTKAFFISIIKSLQIAVKEKNELQEIKDNDGDLEGYIHEFLDSHRCLVVIDSVWHYDVWKILEKALEENKNGSRLLITTRNKNLAKEGKRFIHHELRFLTPEESWNLFCKNSYVGKEERIVFSPAKEILAKEMLEKCSGLPLAVVELAKLLSKTKKLEAWYQVKKQIWKQLKLASKNIAQLFSLSYSHLSKEQQLCFLYMAMFPEGFQIDVEKLKNLWMAEGLATNKDDAEKLVQELINWNLILISGTLWETVAICGLHDLVRDLAIDKATEVDFFKIFDPFIFNSLPQKPDAIHGPLQNYVSLSHYKRYISTLLFFKGYREYLTEIQLLSKKWMNYMKLEVLDLMGINLSSNNNFLEAVLAKMCHLKFLGLANTSVREIPSTIGNLSMLQTLDVGGKYRCRLPKEASSLTNLTNLLGRFEGPLPIEGLNKLHTLKVIDSDQLDVLKSCENINELAVWSKKDEFTLNFVNCRSVETLIIISSHDLLLQFTRLEECSHLRRLWLHGLLREIPKWDGFSSSLTSLILSKSRLTHDPMETLEKLPCLSNLELKNAYTGKKIVCHKNGFSQLEVLRLCKLYELDEWVVEEGALPKLRGLGIFECYKLKKPENLKTIPEVSESEVDYYLQKMIN